MDRASLLAQRAALLPLYASPDPESDMQWLEVRLELAWIAERLKDLPRPSKPAEEPPKRRRYGNRGMDRSAGRS